MQSVISQGVDLSQVDEILDQKTTGRDGVIPILQAVQEVYGYLPREALARVAQRLGVPFSRLYGVATFYSQFYLTRRGKNIIKVCDGTACHVRGAPRILEGLQKDLAVPPGQPTEDYQFTYEVVYCLGSCALAPVAVVNDEVQGRCTAERMHKAVEGLRG